MIVVTLNQHLTNYFSFLQQKLKNGRAKHIKEIHAFQKYFETAYDPDYLSQKAREAVITLKEKMFPKLPNLRIPDYVNDKYTFTLRFYPPKFSSFPTSEMALAFVPQFPWWFICAEILKVHKNEFLKPAQRVTQAKHGIYSFKGHLHVDIKHARVETPIHEGEESERSLPHIF